MQRSPLSSGPRIQNSGTHSLSQSFRLLAPQSQLFCIWSGSFESLGRRRGIVDCHDVFYDFASAVFNRFDLADDIAVIVINSSVELPVTP